MSALLLSSLFVAFAQASREESRLIHMLYTNYDKAVRPSARIEEPVKVSLAIIIQQIIDMDIKAQTLTVNVWLNYAWNDYRLRWEPREHGNITDLRFPSSELWKPDILLYNSADAAFDSTYGSNIIVYNTGDISWIPPGVFLCSCKVDITWFPFDEQNCEMKFGSWSMDDTKMDLVTPAGAEVDMSEYMVSGEFDMWKPATVIRTNRYYACCPESYQSLHFTLHMRRRPLYFGVNLVMPCTLMTVMTLLGFLLPSRGCQKITLQITICLAIIMFLVMLSNMIPQTSEAVPILGVFFCVCFVLVSVSVIFAVIAEMIFHTHPELGTMGTVTSTLFLNWLPWLLFMDRPQKHNSKKKQRPRIFTINQSAEFDASEIILMRNFDTWNRSQDSEHEAEVDIDARIERIYGEIGRRRHELHLDVYTESMMALLYLTYKQIKLVAVHVRAADAIGNCRNDWAYASRVVDKSCLVLMTLFIVLSTLYIFFSAPYLTVDVTEWNKGTP